MSVLMLLCLLKSYYVCIYTCCGKGLLAFHTGAALTAGFVTPDIARPRLGIVYAKRLATTHDVCLSQVGIGGAQTDVDEGACRGCSVKGIDKFRTTVGIDGMVAPVVGHHDILQPVRLSDAHSYREHDTIAEGNYRRLHIVVSVMPLRNILATLQQRALEIARHEIERDDDMADA